MEPESHAFQESKDLIDRLRSGVLPNQELRRIAERLDVLLPDPHWYEYTIDHVPELASEEIVRRAFAYRPIQL